MGTKIILTWIYLKKNLWQSNEAWYILKYDLTAAGHSAQFKCSAISYNQPAI